VVVDWGQIEVRIVIQIVQHLKKSQHDEGGLQNGGANYRVT